MCGVYPDASLLGAGEEVSSTYEGRHITMLESELIHPNRASDYVNVGDPVLICKSAAHGSQTTYGQAVGVAFKTATAATDLIAVDTEGIWKLMVHADDDSGTVDVNPGDPLFIHDASLNAAGAGGLGDALISKRQNVNTQVPFGYALGFITAADSKVIAVKVHFDPNYDINGKYYEIIAGTPAGALGFDIHVEDTSIPTGNNSGVKITYNASGADLGAVYQQGLEISCTPTGYSAGWSYGAMIGLSPAGITGVQGEMAGLFIFCNSFATKTIGNYHALALGLHNDGTCTNNSLIYLRGHGAVAVDHAIQINVDSITNLFSFNGVGTPVVAGAPAGGTTYYLNVDIGGVPCGIICDTVA